MSPETSVFIDALMELGFQPFDESNFGALVRVFKKDDHGKGWPTSIAIRIYPGHMDMTWWDGQRSPRFSYLFPEQWLDAMARVRDLIRLAEEALRTGVLPAGPLEPEWGINNWRIHQRRP